MPYADANGIKLYYEEAGRGAPIRSRRSDSDSAPPTNMTMAPSQGSRSWPAWK